MHAGFLRLECLSGPSFEMTKPPLFFLWAGPKHGGKSSTALELVEKVKSLGLKVGGIVAPSKYEGGKLIGFDIINLQTGQKRCLSRLCSVIADGKRFEFTKAGEKFGKGALDPEKLKGCNLIVIDEFGPFEIQGCGWRKEIDLLIEFNIAPLLIILRKELKKQVQVLYNIPAENVFTTRNGKSIIDKIAGYAQNR
jgi:nucleoside-triphosphatase THEP1